MGQAPAAHKTFDTPPNSGPYRRSHVMPLQALSRRSLRMSALAAGLLASGVALADAHLDPTLLSKMQAAAAADQLQIVISYQQSVPVTPGQVAALKSLGI